MSSMIDWYAAAKDLNTLSDPRSVRHAIHFSSLELATLQEILNAEESHPGAIPQGELHQIQSEFDALMRIKQTCEDWLKENAHV